MLRVSYYANLLWKVALAGACAAMVILWPNWRVALSHETYYEGRMTGGGACTTNGVKVATHGFTLHCDPNDEPNNLQVNWKNGTENKFHLENLDFARCTDDPNIDQNPPVAPFDTYEGSGTGRLNGNPDAEAFWTFTDQGEPGKFDTMEIQIFDNSGGLVLNVECTLDVGGNHQAHRDN